MSDYEGLGGLDPKALDKISVRGFIKDSTGYKVFRVVNIFVLLLFSAIIIIPLLNILALAFSDSVPIVSGDVGLWPVGFNLFTFNKVVSDGLFWRQYANTVIYTVLYTAIAMVLTTSFAYAISRKGLKGKSALTWIALFTMYFGPGIVPSYVLVNRVLGWHNSIWAMIIPGTISVFNLLVMKTTFENFPVELEEAAFVDGMTTYGTLLRVVLPLSKAILATMVLFYAVGMWNSWWGAFLYLDDNKMFPVTMYLRNLIASSANTAGMSSGSPDAQVQIGANIKSVAMVLITVPIVCVYPFIQKYFVSGVMLGAVKA